MNIGDDIAATMARANRRSRLADALDAIAIIDPSTRPIPRCPTCAQLISHPECLCPAGAELVAQGAVAYAERYRLVLFAMHLAVELGYPTGVGFDPAEPGWPVFYIELPTGQVWWHTPAHPDPYDDRTTEEKYRRIAEYGSQVRAYGNVR